MIKLMAGDLESGQSSLYATHPEQAPVHEEAAIISGGKQILPAVMQYIYHLVRRGGGGSVVVLMILERFA